MVRAILTAIHAFERLRHVRGPPILTETERKRQDQFCPPRLKNGCWGSEDAEFAPDPADQAACATTGQPAQGRKTLDQKGKNQAILTFRRSQLGNVRLEIFVNT